MTKRYGIASLLKKGESENALIVIRPTDLQAYTVAEPQHSHKYPIYIALSLIDMVEPTGPTDLSTFLMPVEIRAETWVLDKNNIHYQED